MSNDTIVTTLTLENLIEIFSRPRLAPYLNSAAKPHDILDRYHANILLSEAMLPTLHYLEVCLRNRIDVVIQKHYNKDWLIDLPVQLLISAQDSQKISGHALKFLRERKRKPTNGDLLAQMTFGFWCAFFHSKYDPILWQRKGALKSVFPNLVNRNRNRRYIEQHLLKIKLIRNRIAHYEPLLGYKLAVKEVHSICQLLIKGMSVEASVFLSEIDRFPKVYKEIVMKND